MEITRYIRKPFYVEAIQVTPENLEDVAIWCHGQVFDKEETYVKVPVKRPHSVRQTFAYIGDWVLKSEQNFKVYTTGSFEKNFHADTYQEERFEEILKKLESALAV